MRLYFKHLLVTFIVISILGILYLILFGFSLTYNGNKLAISLKNEGPHVFHLSDSTVSVNYIEERSDNSLSVKSSIQAIDTMGFLQCYYPLDSSFFNFRLHRVDLHEEDEVEYTTSEKIIAISDIEGNFRAFRDFLINNGVIDKELKWSFGKGHLVLVGDFVDRGSFVTQTLWLIYKLEYEAQLAGGRVHYILGNHELKNLYGDYLSSVGKYMQTSAALGKQQFDLYGPLSHMGRWLEKKNVIVKINNNVFVHGGIHPDALKYRYSFKEINVIVKNSYRGMYFKSGLADSINLLRSNFTGLCWYRGYFTDSIHKDTINKLLNHLNIAHIIVGHTLQDKITSFYQGKIIGIDVLHPQDQYNYFPKRKTEGLLIENGEYYRLSDFGRRELLEHN